MDNIILKIMSKMSGEPIELVYDYWFNIRVYAYRFINGNYWVLALYLIATVYILIREKDMNKKCLMVIYPLMLSTVVFCPFFFKIVRPILDNTYFRVFWMYPAGIVVAYAAVDLIYIASKKYVRLAVFIGCITVIMAVRKIYIYRRKFYRSI